jgi:hypothetical protein
LSLESPGNGDGPRARGSRQKTMAIRAFFGWPLASWRWLAAPSVFIRRWSFSGITSFTPGTVFLMPIQTGTFGTFWFPPVDAPPPLNTLFIFPLESAAGLAQTALHLPFREWAAILWGPVAGAIEAVLLMMTMRQLRFPLWWAALIVCAGIASLARRPVGSLPESFGPTSTLLALLLLSAQALSGVPLRPWRWVVCGVLLSGTTIANIVPWWLVLCSTLFLTGVTLNDCRPKAGRLGLATKSRLKIAASSIAPGRQRC